MSYYSTIMETPTGPFLLIADDEGVLVRATWLQEDTTDAVRLKEIAERFPHTPDEARLSKAVQQINAYFAGEREDFDVPLKLHGTNFQVQVWEQLRRIPFGHCITYGDIAHALNNPGSVRAVGMANNQNPIPLIVPCHRVIGSNGHLVGFGGGVGKKHQLLVHEGYLLC